MKTLTVTQARYEVRAGLDQRLVFRECDDCLSFEFMGNHDDVQRFLKYVK